MLISSKHFKMTPMLIILASDGLQMMWNVDGL